MTQTTRDAAIEAAARAIYEAAPGEFTDSKQDWTNEYPDTKATVRLIATAAFDAILGALEENVDSSQSDAALASAKRGRDVGGYPTSLHEYHAIYRAMLSALMEGR